MTNNLQIQNRSKIERIIADGLRHAISDHGPVTKEWIGSATKRIYARLKVEAREQRKLEEEND